MGHVVQGEVLRYCNGKVLLFSSCFNQRLKYLCKQIMNLKYEKKNSRPISYLGEGEVGVAGCGFFFSYSSPPTLFSLIK